METETLTNPSSPVAIAVYSDGDGYFIDQEGNKIQKGKEHEHEQEKKQSNRCCHADLFSWEAWMNALFGHR